MNMQLSDKKHFWEWSSNDFYLLGFPFKRSFRFAGGH